MTSKFYFIAVAALIMVAGVFKSSGQGVLRQDAGYDFYTHPDKGMDVPFASVTSSEGFTFVTGTSADFDEASGKFQVICIDENGSLVWEKRLPGTTYSSDYGLAITLDEAENVIVSGVKWNGHDMDMLTMKLDASDGTTIWESLYAGTQQFMDVPYKVITDAGGDIIITGITYTGSNTSWLTLKYNASGSLSWAKVMENNLVDSYIEPKDIHVSADGNIGITGYHGNDQYYQCFYTIVYNEAGDVLWDDLYEPGGSELINSSARGITGDEDGNWYVTGILDLNNPKMHTLKYGPTGELMWEKTAVGEWSQGFFIENGENAVYVAGRHFGDWVDDGTLLISYNYDGTENWTQVTNDLIDIRFSLFVLDASGNPVISGLGYDSETFNNRLKAIRYDAGGNVTDEWVYNIENTAFGSFTEYQQLSADAAGNIYMTFNAFYTEIGGVFEVTKVAFSGEGFEWDFRFGKNGASAIELLSTFNDDQNNTYLTGMYDTIIGTDLYRVYVVSKYNSTGSLEWEKLLSGLNGNEANGIQMRVADNGDAYVFLGAEYGGPIRIKKYNTEGVLQWEKEEMPGTHIYEVFTLDNDGNFIMAGSGEYEGTMQFFTRKIAASGEDLWTAYDNRPGYSDELHNVGEVVTDETGNIYLTGKAGTGGWISQETDITILKYSPSGELLWMSSFPEEGMNTVGESVFISSNGDIFVNGYIEDRSNGHQQMLVMKLDEAGEQMWKQYFMESGRRVSSYNTVQLSTGDIIVSGYSVIDGVDNKVILVKYNTDGNLIEVYETEYFRFYRDIHVDAADNLYLYTQMTSSPYPMKPYFSAGAMPLGTLVKLTFDGQMSEEKYYGPELSDFYPCMLLPMNDGRLLLSGKISNEMAQFGGFYFFEAEHVAVGIKEPVLTEAKLAGQVYPNPVKEFAVLPITLDRGADVSIEVLDVSGRTVMVPFIGFMPGGANQVKIDVSELQKGMYIFNVRCGIMKESGKFVVN